MHVENEALSLYQTTTGLFDYKTAHVNSGDAGYTRYLPEVCAKCAALATKADEAGLTLQEVLDKEGLADDKQKA